MPEAVLSQNIYTELIIKMVYSGWISSPFDSWRGRIRSSKAEWVCTDPVNITGWYRDQGQGLHVPASSSCCQAIPYRRICRIDPSDRRVCSSRRASFGEPLMLLLIYSVVIEFENIRIALVHCEFIINIFFQ